MFLAEMNPTDRHLQTMIPDLGDILDRLSAASLQALTGLLLNHICSQNTADHGGGCKLLSRFFIYERSETINSGYGPFSQFILLPSGSVLWKSFLHLETKAVCAIASYNVVCQPFQIITLLFHALKWCFDLNIKITFNGEVSNSAGVMFTTDTTKPCWQQFGNTENSIELRPWNIRGKNSQKNDIGLVFGSNWHANGFDMINDFVGTINNSTPNAILIWLASNGHHWSPRLNLGIQAPLTKPNSFTDYLRQTLKAPFWMHFMERHVQISWLCFGGWLVGWLYARERERKSD